MPPLERVMLDGSASADPEGDVLTYAWTFLETPEGSGAEFSNPASMVPWFDADLAGVYEAGLAVRDREMESPQDSVMITVAAEGRPDGDFGTERKGAVFYDNGDEDRGVSVMLLGNGKAVLAGSSYNGFDWDIFFRRYNIDGSPDTTFGTGGTVTYDGVGTSESCYDAVMLSDGKMLAAGMLDGDMAVWRFSKDGSLDTGFGSSGIALYDTAGGAARCTSAAVQPDGKILAAGHWNQGGDSDIILLRYTAGGSLDTGFGPYGSGRVQFDGFGDDDWSDKVVLQPDGKILVAGSVWENGGLGDALLLRYE